MGLEALCAASYGDQRSEGKAKLEPEGISFRGDFRLDIPMKDIVSAEAKKGELAVTFGRHKAVFELGPSAEKWALKIRYPKSRAQKLGLKPGQTVAVLNLHDEQLLQELNENGGVVAKTGAKEKADIIFYCVGSVEELKKLSHLRQSIKPAGAIWVLAPKGSKVVRESDVLAAGKANGLTDTKVVSFSDLLTAHKMVIPLAQRA